MTFLQNSTTQRIKYTTSSGMKNVSTACLANFWKYLESIMGTELSFNGDNTSEYCLSNDSKIVFSISAVAYRRGRTNTTSNSGRVLGKAEEYKVPFGLLPVLDCLNIPASDKRWHHIHLVSPLAYHTYHQQTAMLSVLVWLHMVVPEGKHFQNVITFMKTIKISSCYYTFIPCPVCTSRAKQDAYFESKV